MMLLRFGVLLCALSLSASAELNGLPPQRKAELERLLADPHALRAEAQAASRAIVVRLDREDVTKALGLIWSKVEEIESETYETGDRLKQQIARNLGQGRFSPSVAAGLRRCVDDSVDGRRVILYGYFWPKAVSETLADMALPPDIGARLALKVTLAEVKPLGFAECGEVMRGYGISPPQP